MAGTKPCPSCGKQFEAMGMHYYHNPECRPTIEGEAREILVGTMLGDGYWDKPAKNPYVGMVNTNRKLLEWWDDRLDYLTTKSGVRVSATAEESAQHIEDGTGNKAVEPGKYKDVMEVRTVTHPELAEFEEWYRTGTKQPPTDIELTPLTVKVWYAGDGGLNWAPSFKSAFASIAANGCNDETARALVFEFERVGFNPNYDGKRLQFPTGEVPGLLDWMGDPLPGCHYKWECYDRDHYKKLKQMRGTDYPETADIGP